LHVVVPIARRAGWDEVKGFAHTVALKIARDAPGEFTANMSKAARKGRIFVDYLRNGRGATFVAAYSTRARPGAPVSTPIAWDELGPKLRPAEHDLASVPRRLARLREDPWAGFASARQSLGARMLAALRD
jgi:bifunctional non-homologous end joining protein LigD